MKPADFFMPTHPSFITGLRPGFLIRKTFQSFLCTGCQRIVTVVARGYRGGGAARFMKQRFFIWVAYKFRVPSVRSCGRAALCTLRPPTGEAPPKQVLRG